MPYRNFDEVPADILVRAAKIRLACFDVDGTLTDGRLIYDGDGGEAKAFHVHDGQGLVLLRDQGIAVAMMTARASAAAERRGAELGIEVHTQVADKLARLQQIADGMPITLEQVAFMGDDVPDLAALRAVGFAIAPANAHPWIGEHVHWCTQAHAGMGAVRECCDLLLTAQGRTARLLDPTQRIDGRQA